MIIAPVALNDVRLGKRAAALASNDWNSVDQWVKLRDIVAIGTSDDYREQDALRFGDEVVL